MLSRYSYVRPKLTAIITLTSQRHLCNTPPRQIYQVKQLIDWDIEEFKEHAFNAQEPTKLPRSENHIPPACQKWFIHNNPTSSLTQTTITQNPPKSSELLPSFWTSYESITVPLELTTTKPNTPNSNAQFTRTEGPLQILLSFLSQTQTRTVHFSSTNEPQIYLAQCPLDTLPASLQADIPTPDLVAKSGKGDIYSSSLWIGRPPTSTPLHRDPNPNFFLQLAGTKIVRLLPPEVGDAVFDDIQGRVASYSDEIGGGEASKSFRGEEMMVGIHKSLMERAVWDGDPRDASTGLSRHICEATVGIGEALFIPKGWWHSVRGVGPGVTASVNWWFR